MKSLDETINGIVNSTKKFDTNLEKIRYVYLSLGKVLCKHTDFFLRADGKITNDIMSFEEFKKVFYDTKENSDDYTVICRSAAEILKKAFDKLGYKSKIVKTIPPESDEDKAIVTSDSGEVIEVDHFFLAVENPDNNETYFLTLAADLPYIQAGMKTRFFATSILYKREDENNITYQTYEGEEIHNTILNENQLRNVDEKIGYINTTYNLKDSKKNRNKSINDYADKSIKMLEEAMISNNLYYFEAEKDTIIYKTLIEKNRFDFFSKPLSELKDSDWNNMKKYTMYCTSQKFNLNDIANKIDEYKNINNWAKEICTTLLPEIHKRYKLKEDINYYYELLNNNFDYTKFSKQIKKDVQNNDISEHNNVILILDKSISLIKMFENHNPKFVTLLYRLSYHFIPNSYLPENNKEYAENKYIAYKFNLLFNYIFKCNDGPNMFKDMEYSEQIVIIKLILEKMFPELLPNNCNKINGYNDKYSPVSNRIQSYIIRNKESSEYEIVFNIMGTENETEYYFHYKPKTNELKPVDLMEILLHYNIISNRLKSKIENIENITNDEIKKSR